MGGSGSSGDQSSGMVCGMPLESFFVYAGECDYEGQEKKRKELLGLRWLPATSIGNLNAALAMYFSATPYQSGETPSGDTRYPSLPQQCDALPTP